MSKIYFNIDQLGDDQTLLKNAFAIALDNNSSSVMLTRADAGYPILYVNAAFTGAKVFVKVPHLKERNDAIHI